MFPHELDSPETLQYMVIRSSQCLTWRHVMVGDVNLAAHSRYRCPVSPLYVYSFFPLKLIAMRPELLSDLA